VPEEDEDLPLTLATRSPHGKSSEASGSDSANARI
jgi:hypothetical protein